LIPLLLTAAIAGCLNEWASFLVVLLVFLFAFLLKGTESFQKLYYLSIPLSFYLILPDGNTGIIFPSELMAGVLFGFTLFNILANNKINISLSACCSFGSACS
jgi:hypothetical protein